MRRLWLWLPPIVYMTAIYYISAASHPLPQVTQIVWDKAIHAVEYAVLAGLLGRAFLGEKLSAGHGCLLAIVVTSLYGATDEWHQLYVPGREGGVLDWVADTLGALGGTVLYGGFGKVRKYEGRSTKEVRKVKVRRTK